MSVYVHMLRGEKYLRLAPWFQLPFLTRDVQHPSFQSSDIPNSTSALRSTV